MDFRFTTEEESFREEVRRFLDTEVTEEMIEEVERTDGIGIGPHTWELMRRMGARRWLAPSFPKEYGGIGATRWQQFILSDEMSYHRAYPAHMIGVGTVGPTLLKYGTEEQKLEYVSRIARGEIEFALGYSEPEAGSDLANLALLAEKKDDCYVINGQKVFTTGAHFSQYIFLAARTDPNATKHKGISLFIVDITTPGITISPLWVMDGERTNETFYDNVIVPAENLVGEESRGFYHILDALAHERIFPVGDMRRLFEEFVSYVKEEGMGGDPLVQQRVADLATTLQALHLIVYQVVWLLEKDKMPISEAAMAKLCWTEFIRKLGDVATEIMGPYGQLMPGSKWAPLKGRIQKLHLSSARRSISAGTTEIQKNVIATTGLKLPR